MELGDLLCTSVLKLSLPPQKHSPDAWLEQQEPVIPMAQNKMQKKKEGKKEEDKIK